MAVAAAALGVATLGTALPAAGEPMHDPPDPEAYGSCPTNWELWWVPDHLGWFEYTLNAYDGKDVNGDGVLCRKVVAGVGVQVPEHDHVWVAKDNKPVR
jgi:hypothetical protein